MNAAADMKLTAGSWQPAAGRFLRTARGAHMDAPSDCPLPAPAAGRRLRQNWYLKPNCTWRGYPMPGMNPVGCRNVHASPVALVSCRRSSPLLNTLKNSANTPIRLLAAEREELRRAQVEHERVVAARRVDRDLLARGRIDVAIVVGAVAVQVAAGRQVVRTGARHLEHRRELDALRQLEHARRHEAMPLVLARRPPLAVGERIELSPAATPRRRERLPVEPPYAVGAGQRVVRLHRRAREAALELERQRVVPRLADRRLAR